MITAFGTMLDSLIGVFLKILLPATGLTPLSIVMWFGIVLGPLAGASAWVLSLVKRKK